MDEHNIEGPFHHPFSVCSTNASITMCEKAKTQYLIHSQRGLANVCMLTGWSKQKCSTHQLERLSRYITTEPSKGLSSCNFCAFSAWQPKCCAETFLPAHGTMRPPDFLNLLPVDYTQSCTATIFYIKFRNFLPDILLYFQTFYII